MRSSPLARRAAPFVFALALGILNVVLLIGPEPLNPSNTSWIFGDNGTYYSAWEEYRHDSHLHFPLAWTERIGYPIGTSVAFLDGLTLAAVLLRLLSPLLPIPFQYLGLWAALSFVLQAYFGYSLCRRLFPDSPFFCALGAVLFSLSLPLTARAAGHTTLLSQWVILAAFDGYFRDPGTRPVRWMWQPWIVAALATSITPYLGVMCALLAVAAVGRLAIERRVGWMTTAALLTATIAIVAVTAATFGVLASDDARTYWAPGYGQFSWNLNSFVNPMASGSILLHPLPLAFPQQYEGYSYLGLGVLVLLALNLVRRPQALTWMTNRALLPLIAICVLSAAIAASMVVTLGARTLYVAQLPPWAVHALGGLRASGRFIWSPYYLIDVGVLAMTYWLWKAPYRNAILAAAIVLQAADALPLRHQVRDICDHRFQNPTTAAAWRGLGQKYEDLVLVPSFQCSLGAVPGSVYSYVYFGKYAALERMRLNSYYAARYTRPQLQAHCRDLARANLLGPLDPRAAYVITDAVRTIWELDGVLSHVCQVADGFNLCTPADPSSPVRDPSWKLPEAAPYTLNDTLDFRHVDGIAAKYETFGWDPPTPVGTWTVGPIAVLRLGLDRTLDRGHSLALRVNATPFLAPLHPRLDVDVVVNGARVTTWTYRIEGWSSVQEAEIPAAAVQKRAGLDIEFRFRDPEAPLYAGTGTSPEFLGLAMQSITVGRTGAITESVSPAVLK